MVEDEKEKILDEDAQKLFEEFRGLEKRDVEDASQSAKELSVVGEAEGNRLDHWRILLVEFSHALGGYLANACSTGQEEGDVELVMERLSKLSLMPNQNGKMLVRYRGIGYTIDGRDFDEFDYVISFGGLTVDTAMAKAVFKRRGIRTCHLSGGLTSAFQQLMSLGINTVHLAMGKWRPEHVRDMRVSMRILRRYYMSVAGTADVSFKEDAQSGPPRVAFNENSRPDPNLTLLAGLNGLKRGDINALVRKVDGMMQAPDSKSAFEEYADVFGAIFAFKRLREQLVKPPVEINSVRWLAMDEHGTVSKERAQVIRMVVEKFGGSHHEAVKVIESLYGGNLGSLSTESLVNRLQIIANLLEVIEKEERNKSIKDELLRNIRSRLEEIRGKVLGHSIVREDLFKNETEQERTDGENLRAKLFEMIDFFNRRSSTKKKIKEMAHRATHFHAQDYDIIARDFEISVQDAKGLLGFLKGCFQKEGSFRRAFFEKNIPDFTGREDRFFELLWHYLKDISHRNNRVAYLTSLQLLISRMQQPKKALNILLEDLIHSPLTVFYSDRNALMLVNGLFRKQGKELYSDTEITVEEAIKVRSELDRELVRAAAELIDGEQIRLFQKIRTIHTRLKEALEFAEMNATPMPARFLVAFEREMFMFLALVEGTAACKVMQSAINEYGNPHSEIYQLTGSRDHMRTLLQLLQVAIRGLGRLGSRNDLPLLQEVKERKEDFLTLMKEARHKDAVERIMMWADTSIEEIGLTGSSSS